MTVVSVIARLVTVNKVEGKTDPKLISRGGNKKCKATYRLKFERSKSVRLWFAMLRFINRCCGLLIDTIAVLNGRKKLNKKCLANVRLMRGTVLLHIMLFLV